MKLQSRPFSALFCILLILGISDVFCSKKQTKKSTTRENQVSQVVDKNPQSSLRIDVEPAPVLPSLLFRLCAPSGLFNDPQFLISAQDREQGLGFTPQMFMLKSITTLAHEEKQPLVKKPKYSVEIIVKEDNLCTFEDHLSNYMIRVWRGDTQVTHYRVDENRKLWNIRPGDLVFVGLKSIVNKKDGLGDFEKATDVKEAMEKFFSLGYIIFKVEWNIRAANLPKHSIHHIPVTDLSKDGDLQIYSIAFIDHSNEKHCQGLLYSSTKVILNNEFPLITRLTSRTKISQLSTELEVRLEKKDNQNFLKIQYTGSTCVWYQIGSVSKILDTKCSDAEEEISKGQELILFLNPQKPLDKKSLVSSHDEVGQLSFTWEEFLTMSDFFDTQKKIPCLKITFDLAQNPRTLHNNNDKGDVQRLYHLLISQRLFYQPYRQAQTHFLNTMTKYDKICSFMVPSDDAKNITEFSAEAFSNYMTVRLKNDEFFIEDSKTKAFIKFSFENNNDNDKEESKLKTTFEGYLPFSPILIRGQEKTFCKDKNSGSTLPVKDGDFLLLESSRWQLVNFNASPLLVLGVNSGDKDITSLSGLDFGECVLNPFYHGATILKISKRKTLKEQEELKKQLREIEELFKQFLTLDQKRLINPNPQTKANDRIDPNNQNPPLDNVVSIGYSGRQDIKDFSLDTSIKVPLQNREASVLEEPKKDDPLHDDKLSNSRPHHLANSIKPKLASGPLLKIPFEIMELLGDENGKRATAPLKFIEKAKTRKGDKKKNSEQNQK